MFLTEADLESGIYGYQIDQITEGDDNIVSMAMAAAEEEVRSYLSGNNRIENFDGRLRYDVDAILSAQDSERNPLILKHTVTIAKWWIVELCNADVIYEQAKERYDRSIKWLTDLRDGTVNLSTLPQLSQEDLDADTRQPFSYGSRPKFNHE
ncbi:phage protein Gp36 family protein [Formosa sp. S-31]|uniref:phage protein Gp36 family protein n=1 Tax=Formosa sp. S-31 TaxID=2790949 RepID=UPI003EBB240A